jgi:hypothetical protein
MKRFLCVALLLLIGGAVPLFAQEQTASIQGAVMDTSNAALPGVTVEAVSTRGQRYTAQTDSSGHYRFPSIPPGTYTVSATLSGMSAPAVKGVQVTLGSTPKVDLTMKMAQVTESLTVTAEAPIVDVTSSATATSLRSESFDKLPKGRDFTSLVAQAAAANNDPKAGGITIDGASGSENVYVVDGVETTNPQTGVSGKTVITDFVDELQVKSAGYAAEYGGAIGGVINVVTKTGTNDLRGSASAYYTPQSLTGKVRNTLQTTATPTGDVASYTVYPKDKGHTIEPGFSLGGPVLRDHLWFFAAYEPIIQSTDRTPFQLTQTYSQDFRRDNGVANVSGIAGSRLTYKAAYNTSGYKTTNLLPSVNGRDAVNPALYTGKNDKFTNWTGSGYADFVATPQWFVSARGGRFYRNYVQSGISNDVRYLFSGGSNSVFPDAPADTVHPAGYSSIPTNSASLKDAYTRDNMSFDASWYPQLAGSHRIKGGVDFVNLANDVFNGETNYLYRFYWNRAEPNSGVRGKYGALRLRQFVTQGNVKSKNTGLFLQDAWTTMNDRLTLNIGVRAEEERVPSYATVGVVSKDAVHFKYGDKLAPRLGFSYDVKGNGSTKVYGSYGKYFDIMKMELPRGSFGGDKWIDADFELNTLDINNLKCTGLTNVITQRPTCNGAVWKTNIDFRHPANAADLNLIDPNLKPMQSIEYTIGAEHQFSNTLAFGIRGVKKHLVRTIEDTGVLVTNPDGTQEEQFFIANPGEGVATRILGNDLPAFPRPKRDYTGLELEATKRFANRFQLHATYLYSRLRGNYSGLANSDEAQGSGSARTSPNVNRFGDALWNLFNAQGQAVEGPLATDRPHQFKAQVAYSFAFGTTVGVNQYVGSGTPFQTEFTYGNVPFFAFGRGDLGRTPWLKQTDLNATHDLKFGAYTVQFGVNVLNLFDSKTAVNVVDSYSAENLRMRDASGKLLSGHAADLRFFQGFDPKAVCAAGGGATAGATPCTRNAQYGSANAFQGAREVRLIAKVIF